MYENPATRLLAAQRALRSTVYGIGRVIRAELNANGMVEYISNTTGSIFSNIEDAVNEASRMGISTSSSIRMKDIMGRNPDALAGNRIGALAGFGESIGKAMQDPGKRAELSRAGLSDDFMDEFDYYDNIIDWAVEKYIEAEEPDKEDDWSYRAKLADNLKDYWAPI